MKILYVTPHLSTGGLPQYLTKKIESLIDEHEIHVVEYDNISCDFVVQRNKILNLIGDKLITLDQNTHYQLTTYIQNQSFDIVHFEEFSESFIDFEILKGVYNSNRTYKILETTHGSHEQKKVFLPDAFVFVSQAHIEMYSKYSVPSHIVEYPIEKKQKSLRTEALAKLGLDPSKKHVLNVGLFTPGKNQGEIFEYAKHLPDYQFHFVGNQAGNFEFYWGDLMKNKPDNCIVWGERHDIELFYDAADLFLFTSKLELNPLVIKEALCWNLPILMYDSPIYYHNFDKYKNITYLSDHNEINLQLLKQEPLDTSSEIVVITAYPDTPEKENFLIDCIKNIKLLGYNIMISSHYNISQDILNMVDDSVIDLTDNLLYRNEYNTYNVSSYIYSSNNQRYITRSMKFNHGFSVWTLWQNAINKLDGDKYKKIHVVDYDCLITDNRYLMEHNIHLEKNDFVFYKSTDNFEHDRVTTNIFSFNYEVGKQLFNKIKNKNDLFNNKYNTSILEQILYHLCVDNKYLFTHIDSERLRRYGTKFDMVCVQDLNITEFTHGDFGYNIFEYDKEYDIIYIKNLKTKIIINNSLLEDYFTGEAFYLLKKDCKHIVTYLDNTEKYDMLEHAIHNKIKIYDETILNERLIK